PEVAAAVRAAEEVARREVPRPEVGTTPSLGPPVRSAFSGQPGAAHQVPRPQAPPAEPPPSDSAEPDPSAEQ
ncbi:MAG: SPFH domain-containing protein, partial [Pseudonocardiaceae bacterium]